MPVQTMQLLGIALCLLVAVAATTGVPVRQVRPDARITSDTHSASDNKRIIETAPGVRRLMSESDVDKLREKKISFMDVTHHLRVPTPKAIGGRQVVGPAYNATLPTVIAQQAIVEPFADHISKENIYNTIFEMSNNFHTRYYQTQDGLNASLWVASMFETLSTMRNGTVTTSFFNHSWAQHSVIASIPGNGTNKDEVVIIGAHLDSINLKDKMNGRAPGADDDASGIALLFEIFRILCASGFQPSRTIEFHAYSGEEGGLLGSQDVAESYYNKGVIVAGMLQLDQASYVMKPRHDVIGVYTDYTNAVLTEYLRLLVATYSTLPSQDSVAGYASSDMASWNKYGYPSCYEAEGIWSEMDNILKHHPTDVLGTFEVDHAIQLGRVAMGFAVEVSMLTTQ